MIVQKLSTEIIQKIFEHLYRIEQTKLLYLCKKWYHAVKFIYFENVTWDSQKILWLRHHLATLNVKSNGTRTLRPFPMTKRLLILENFGKPHTQFTAREFLYLLSLFPNLKCLDMTACTHKEHYMNILCKSDPKERLRFLEQIDVDWDHAEDNYQVSLEFATLYHFRRTLRHITICYTNKLANGKNILKLLPDFTRLSTLKVVDLDKLKITLFDLLQACPSLSELSYSASSEIPAKAAEQSAESIKDLDQQNSFICQPLPNLKKLTLNICTLPKSYIDFFKNNCPENLNDLKIYLTGTDMYEWIDRLTMDVAVEFCKSLQNIPSVELCFSILPIEDRRGIDPFYRILNALTGKREFDTRSLVHTDRDTYSWTSNRIHVAGSKLEYEYCIRIEGDINGNHAGENMRPTPSVSTLKQLAQVSKLKIRTKGVEPDYINPRPKHKHYLEYAKTYFPNLIHFQISCDDNINEERSLLLAKCPPYSRSLENMAQVSLNGYAYPEDIFKDLLVYLPNIKVLNFSLCTLLTSDDTDKIAFDLKNFQQLHTFIIGTDFLSRFNVEETFLRFTDDSKKTKLFIYRSVYYIKLIEWLKPTSNYTLQKAMKSSPRGCIYTIHVKGLSQLKTLEIQSYN